MEFWVGTKLGLNKEFQDFHFTQGETTGSIEEHHDVRETSSCLPNEPIIGRNVQKQEIINLLSAGTNNEDTVIVAIYGGYGQEYFGTTNL